MPTKKVDPRRTTIIGPDGKKIPLSSLPLVAYALNCNHVGKDYGVQKRDIIWCEQCSADRRVSKILAS